VSNTPVIDLTDEQLLRIMRTRPDLRAAANREDLKDKSYQDSPIGQEVAAFLRVLSKRAAKNTMDAYESTLDKFARFFPDLTLEEFDQPGGIDLIEEFLEAEWGDCKATTYNRHRAALVSFFKFFKRRRRMNSNPAHDVDTAKQQPVFHEAFSADATKKIIAGQGVLRDRIALRLLLHYGLRRSSLQAIQFKHFDHVRRKLTVFLKGGKIRTLPIPQEAFWHDLERHILDAKAEPDHYLLTARWRNRYGYRDIPDKPMSAHGLHEWWYRCLANAGIVTEGTTSGERMHKARHTAGQAMLDATGNLKAVQKLLGHESIQTTADVYVDWDDDQIAASLLKTWEDDT
jgi:integrase/recombinase XerC